MTDVPGMMSGGQVPISRLQHPVTDGPSVTVQQICVPVQQLPPQQVIPELHAEPVGVLHGGVPHVPLAQKGLIPAQVLPQLPQFRMSLSALTQNPLQHLNPWQSGSP
jgi:hypothetical protein